MNREDIIRMAREAGFLSNEIGSYLISPYTFEDQDLFEELERFAQLVAAAERNRLATELGKMPLNDTASSIASWIRGHE